jgi:hypothetical protein
VPIWVRVVDGAAVILCRCSVWECIRSEWPPAWFEEPSVWRANGGMRPFLRTAAKLASDSEESTADQPSCRGG